MTDTSSQSCGGGGSDGGSSCFRKAVMLGDWWLIKSGTEFEGKGFGVAGTELVWPNERRPVRRAFSSAPIVKAFDVFTLETADKICIIIKGFINKERTILSGFSPEVFKHFGFGFPPDWEAVTEKCFKGDSCAENGFGSFADINKLRIDPVARGNPVLTPCKNKRVVAEYECDAVTERPVVSALEPSKVSGNECHPSALISPARSKMKDVLNEGEDGPVENVSNNDIVKNGASEKPFQPKAVDECDNDAEEKGKNKDTVKNNALEKPLQPKALNEDDDSAVENDGNNGNLKNTASEKPLQPLGSDVNGVRSPNTDAAMTAEPTEAPVDEYAERMIDRESRGESKDRKTRKKYVTKEPANLERVNRCLRSNDSTRSGRALKNSVLTGKKRNSNKVSQSINEEGNINPLNRSGTSVEENESCIQGQNSSKGKTKRRINFDLEATPCKQERNEKKAFLSSDSLSVKRSRSGRLLVSTLEFWRNQVPVYDADRKIIGIQEDVDSRTPLRGSRSGSSKRRRKF